MAFEFTLDTPHFDINSIGKADEHVATIDIGFDQNLGTTFKILLALAPIAALPPDHRELFFSLIESNPHEVVRNYRNGLETKNFLTGDERVSVLDAVACGASYLVKKANPSVLVFNTLETNLPQKALAKYHRICAEVCKAGYQGGKVDSYHGSEQWHLVKV